MLLALDTATPLVSVALHDGDGVVAERLSERPMKHGEQLAPLIAQVLADASVSRTQLTEIGVGVGPGPFTGLRVGLVTARTLGFVLQIPVTGVCSLDVIAAEVADSGVGEDLTSGFTVATDARRKEVYWASYDVAGRRSGAPQVTRPADLPTDLVDRPTAGEGPVLYPDAFGPPLSVVRPSAGWLARALQSGTVERLDPEPLYLRRPDAVAPAAPKRVS